MMRTDWRAAFYCPSGADRLTADGICIGHTLAQSFILRRWEASSTAPVTPGTVLTSRLMVSEPCYRKSLRQFASAAAGGLAEDELQQLVADMAAEGDSQPEAEVVPLLDMAVDSGVGRLLAAPPCRALLRSLGTTAPAIQLLPQVLWQITLHGEALATRRCHRTPCKLMQQPRLLTGAI
jgi:hypothetical protein